MRVNKQMLNGAWMYRIGKGAWQEKQVPFSGLPVGHSECMRTFDLEYVGERIFLQFEGITYAAKVFLNDTFLGDMLPYCEYSFDVTTYVQPTDNRLLVALEDIAPKFGPSEGWENYGGIIRDVSLSYKRDNYIQNVFFHARLTDQYQSAFVTVEVETEKESACLVRLSYAGEAVLQFQQTGAEERFLENVNLWSPDHPHLYDLEVSLLEGDMCTDTYTCRVGFREFTCDAHRFWLNGEPIFIKGVCKHEMFGNSGHCPSEDQMRRDMEMIKETGSNFVRLVHYPHNKRVLEIADEIGLLVSEEPGLWWSDTANDEVREGSLEVLQRTILRDRNHPCVAFWLAFNECRFAERFLVESARVCRENDPTRLVSGANCMNNEDTLKYYALCGFDFYTMHPYSDTTARAKESAAILNDKPLLFTEWGGYYVYDNPRLLGEFLDEFYHMYSDEKLAGALLWEWSELYDLNRDDGACVDGMLCEGLVDADRHPRMNYQSFCRALARMGNPRIPTFWFEQSAELPSGIPLAMPRGDEYLLNDIVHSICEQEARARKMRKRKLKNGPILCGVFGLADNPLVVTDAKTVTVSCNAVIDRVILVGAVSLTKGYPLSGEYGEAVADVVLRFEDDGEYTYTLRNGIDVTTAFATNGSSRICPVAEKAVPFANFGYDKNFERYLLNVLEVPCEAKGKVAEILLRPCGNGYSLLTYGIYI